MPLKFRDRCINYVSNISDVGSGFHNEFRSEGSKLMQWTGLIPWSMPIFAIRKILLISNQNLTISRFKLIAVSPRGNGDQWQSTCYKAPWTDPQFFTQAIVAIRKTLFTGQILPQLHRVSSAILRYQLCSRKFSYLNQ